MWEIQLHRLYLTGSAMPPMPMPETRCLIPRGVHAAAAAAAAAACPSTGEPFVVHDDDDMMVMSTCTDGMMMTVMYVPPRLLEPQSTVNMCSRM
jgi:hypothetical protein